MPQEKVPKGGVQKLHRVVSHSSSEFLLGVTEVNGGFGAGNDVICFSVFQPLFKNSRTAGC